MLQWHRLDANRISSDLALEERVFMLRYLKSCGLWKDSSNVEEKEEEEEDEVSVAREKKQEILQTLHAWNYERRLSSVEKVRQMEKEQECVVGLGIHPHPDTSEFFFFFAI